MGYLSVVYGLNTSGARQSLWDRQALNISNVPWLVTGDYNTSRFTDEKVGGRTLFFQQLSAFNDFISACSLFDLKFVRSKWSWNIKSTNGRRITGGLERTLCNG